MYLNPETMATAAAYVQREYGFTGYALEPATLVPRGHAIFNVRHADGSEFRIMADQWGNADTIPETGSVEAITEFFTNANAV